MSDELPSFLEDHISQIPALQLLQNLGWQHLRPAEAVALRAAADWAPCSWRPCSPSNYATGVVVGEGRKGSRPLVRGSTIWGRQHRAAQSGGGKLFVIGTALPQIEHLELAPFKPAIGR